ncbi:MAG: hypothetical protein JW881_13390 [Spirochaetales bacterium]|nr:hypothetical protein [Spirochaetales bacterium]
MRKTLCLLLIIMTTAICLHSFADEENEEEDDNKTGELFDKIEKEKEKDEEEDDSEGGKTYKDDDGGTGGCLGKALGGCISGCLDEMGPVFFEIFFTYMFSVRYSDYPYSPESGHEFSFVRDETAKSDGQIGFLKLSASAAYLMDERVSFTGLIETNLTLIHANLFFQYTYESPYWFTFFSVNGGISIPVFNVMVTGYIGGLSFTASEAGASLPEPLFSYGGSLHIFFFHNIYCDIFNLNAHYRDLGFHIFSFTLNYCIGFVSVGAGYNLNLYGYDYSSGDGLIFQGPFASLKLWL